MASRSCEPELDFDLYNLLEPRGAGRCGAAAADPAGDAPASDACCAPPAQTFEPGAYGPMVRRVQERLEGEEERADADLHLAHQLFRELMALSPERREGAIASEPRFASYPLADRLLAAAEESSGDDPATADELAFLGLAVAARLEPERWSRGLVEDLAARAWALLGETWSASGAHEAARMAFRLAKLHLDRGSGDPLEEAQVLFHQASLPAGDGAAVSQDSLERAATIFLQNGDLHRLGRSLGRKARLAAAAGDHRSAVTLLGEARTLLGDEVPEEERAELGRLLARSLLAEGAADEAWTEIARARSCLRSRPDSRIEARLRALEGRVALAADLTEEAATCLTEARDALLALG
ncbi:MAG: hypothetical protein PVG07_15340, partial [Acidobacteriota bacterium]